MEHENLNTEKPANSDLGAVIERFTIDDAKEVVAAWEALKGGRNYSAIEIEQWLINNMKPVIDKFRAKINAL